ncbi:MAG TPA: thiamine pyrophosphate-dependent dehydrogenase E1 component subunit alpha [Candidatus Sulfotelmatobacter sp.]|nr:thiamine pyrophosphate-dependent dehydrogenase E1 component subunit alpha [Candidatus Sulfotelmatobacter sp.]
MQFTSDVPTREDLTMATTGRAHHLELTGREARHGALAGGALLLEAYQHMMRARLVDERITLLNRQGLAPFWVSGMGHEAVQVAAGMAIRAGRDWVAPYYRDLALSLVMGMTAGQHFLSALARRDEPNGGRQMPAHYGSRRLRIISTGSCVTTQLLHAAGIALASKMRGEDAVTLATLGDGATSEGDFHEALNFAAIHRLPLICVVENNGYAISVPWHRQMGSERIADRAKGYGIAGVTVDGGDVSACYQACYNAVERARRGEGSTLIDARVQRLASHSSDDDQRRYRSATELEADRKVDCLERARTLLQSSGLMSSEEAGSLRARITAELDDALSQAEAAPLPEAESALPHVYGTPTAR